MESTQYFVKQVANNINKNHAKDRDGSFIFGISGKWGAGKTRFLKELTKELEDKEDDVGNKFKIVTINPWKFASDNDNISFLRNFLKTLFFGLENKSKVEEDLKSLDFDTSETTINWGAFLVFIIVLCILGNFFHTLDSTRTQFHLFLLDWKSVITLILIPIFLTIIGNLFTVQKSNHSVSTIDDFDAILNKIVDTFLEEKKKVVIFVDDLDRVTPIVAHDVLDNLRTFFDKQNISFVVTGDHTVLERYLGNDLLPDGSLPEQDEEGRRFLKKIFNVYWRLPLPLDKEVEKFISDLFEENKSDLEKIFPLEDNRETFAIYLRKYFGKNFRQIIRFVDTTVFTFEVIYKKLEGAENEQKRYFQELADKPLLVVRILMIQELCAPLFDKILDEQKILRDLEYAVEKKDTATLNSIVDGYKTDLSPSQSVFIKTFLYQEPRFYKGSSWTVSDIRSFLFLAADSSFSDQRGMSAEDFTATLATGDPAQIKEVLLNSGDENLEADANVVIQQLPNVADMATRASHLKAMTIALSELPIEYSVHKIFANGLKSLDISFLDNILPQKIETINSLWNWLDVVNDPVIYNEYESKFAFSNTATDLDAINLDKAGLFTSSIVTNWLKSFYASNPSDSLDRMITFFPKLKAEKVKENMEAIQGTIVNDLVTQNDNLREKRFEVVKNYTTTGSKNLKDRVFEQINLLNSNLTQWAFSKAGPEEIWEKTELEEQVTKRLRESPDFSSLTQGINFVVSENNIDFEKAWKEILSHTKLISENISTFVSQQHQGFTPSDKQADHLMDIFVQKIKTSSEEEQKILLPFVKKDQWLWANLNNYPLSTQLADIGNTTNEDLKKIYEETLTTWGQKVEEKKSKKK